MRKNCFNSTSAITAARFKMKKHLFLEGPIQEGKSTLIRKLIKANLTQIGGFSSQRLLDDSGKTVGFRITPAGEAIALTKKYSPELPDVFLFFDGSRTENMPGIFADTAVRYLRENEGKKLILLDEIGGVELLSPEFRRELYRILAGDIPCLGVLKLESSVRGMCGNTAIDSDCIAWHLQLRDDLVNRYGAEIIYFERTNAEQTEELLRDFVDRII
jgi:nucleoside-triphosphatase THEP1